MINRNILKYDSKLNLIKQNVVTLTSTRGSFRRNHDYINGVAHGGYDSSNSTEHCITHLIIGGGNTVTCAHYAGVFW